MKAKFDSKAKTIIALTNEQRKEIMESKKEIKQGLSIEHGRLSKDVSKWLLKTETRLTETTELRG